MRSPPARILRYEIIVRAEPGTDAFLRPKLASQLLRRGQKIQSFQKLRAIGCVRALPSTGGSYAPSHRRARGTENAYTCICARSAGTKTRPLRCMMMMFMRWDSKIVVF